MSEADEARPPVPAHIVRRPWPSRSRVIGSAAASLLLIAALAAVSFAPLGAAVARAPRVQHQSSVAAAQQFLRRMMDRRAGGRVPRLVQSFAGGRLGQAHFTDSETYDDALVIDAFLSEGTRGSRLRAETVADGLLFVQRHDPRGDGRIRAAYAPDPLRSASDVHPSDRATDVGNMAWVAMALARLAARSHDGRYLHAAVSIGVWVDTHCRDRRGAGGFTGGYTAAGRKIRWKSTEHNIDLYALYRMLAAQTGRQRFIADAAWARHFVRAMWQPAARTFAVGTSNNGRSLNRGERPEDVNSWSYLALHDSAYAASVQWDLRHLSVHGPGYAGVSFCAGDRTGAWYEGTAHLADALELRGSAGDGRRAHLLLADIRRAQRSGPHSNGRGIIAASKNRLSDCDGDFYYSSLHTGATAWYILAARHIDPFTARVTR